MSGWLQRFSKRSVSVTTKTVTTTETYETLTAARLAEDARMRKDALRRIAASERKYRDYLKVAR
jgi:hypothetical protein